jgi:hypothetical protein
MTVNDSACGQKSWLQSKGGVLRLEGVLKEYREVRVLRKCSFLEHL